MEYPGWNEVHSCNVIQGSTIKASNINLRPCIVICCIGAADETRHYNGVRQGVEKLLGADVAKCYMRLLT
jgi:hypothetical protein